MKSTTFKRFDVVRIVDIGDNESYAENGFLCRLLTDFRDVHCNDILQALVSFEEFPENRLLETPDYYNVSGVPCLTASQARQAVDREELWWEDPDACLELVHDAPIDWHEITTALPGPLADKLHRWLTLVRFLKD